MKYIYLLSLLWLLISCGGEYVKIKPDHTGIDPKIVNYHRYFIDLAKKQGIEFKKPISIGFKDLKGSTVGMCTYGISFREIDIDINFWNNSSEATKIILFFHEMTHCYCSRGHSYGSKAEHNYPEDFVSNMIYDIKRHYFKQKNTGFFDDNCPTSIMYPVILSDKCIFNHYEYYLKEMLNKCFPWR